MKSSASNMITAVLAIFATATAWAQSVKPPDVEIPGDLRKGTVPDYFMLNMTAPGCDPGEDCDDVGPPRVYRNWYLDQTGCNVGGMGVSWPECEKARPRDGEPTYDFSGVSLSERGQRMKFKICRIHSGGAKWISDPGQGIGPRWVEREDFKFATEKRGKKVVSERYWRRFEHFVEAACRHVREKYGVTIFSTGGNERDLVARDTYQNFYPDWHFYYMAPIVHIHKAMKRAHPDNKLIIGNLCYTDGPHVDALYQAGAKGNFEILAIHNYGKAGVHLDMYQIMESHKALAKHGDGDIGIVLFEGWSCFPLPERIDRDPANRRPGGHRYTPEDCEHYRQTVLDGWRNLMTPRPGEYDPKWVIGANYFVLNDHWGGRGWEKRAVAKYEQNGKIHEVPATEYRGQGKIRAFKLDGYEIGTGDPLWIKPFLRPWGLIDIHGKPKGDTIFNFPPYLPKHEIRASVEEPLPDNVAAGGHEYPVTVTFTNRENSPMSDFRLKMIGRDDEAKKVRFRFVGGDPDREVKPDRTITRRYVAVFPRELARAEKNKKPRRIRCYADAHYTWESRPYHTDAWLPNVLVTLPLSLRLGAGQRTAPGPEGEATFAVAVASTHAAPLAVKVRVQVPPEVSVEPAGASATAPARGQAELRFRAKLRDPAKTGIYELKAHAGEGVKPLTVPVAFPASVSTAPTGFGLRNPSFEDVGAESGYAFWEGPMPNWIQNGEAESLPGAGKRAFGAATDWMEFDYTLSQSVDLPKGAAGKRIKATIWYVARAWDAEAKTKDVKGQIRLVFLDAKGQAISKKDGPEEPGSRDWRKLSLMSDAIPTPAREVRMEVRLASHQPRGCHRGAMDMAKIELIP